jgi:murein DD-endopeptidase MepM/ murein hydrolase activator NlpD
MKGSQLFSSLLPRVVLKLLHAVFDVCLVILLVACVPGTDAQIQLTELSPITTTILVSTPSPTQDLPLISTPTQSVVKVSTPEYEGFPQICSPLEGVSLSQLEGMISNPFHPPLSGWDDPHQGVDLADVDPSSVALSGRQISAVLTGKVAAVIRDRFPYGNAVLLETTWNSLPAEWINRLDLPVPGAPPATPPTLTCPAPSSEPVWDLEVVSLYLLYAHLQDMPVFDLGDDVMCGQVMGAIGLSGNALNPHLHLEVRTGPAGARFESMAHYDPSAFFFITIISSPLSGNDGRLPSVE